MICPFFYIWNICLMARLAVFPERWEIQGEQMQLLLMKLKSEIFRIGK